MHILFHLTQQLELSMQDIHGVDGTCVYTATWSWTYFSEHGVPDGAKVDGTFICQIIENVEGSDGFGTLLLVAKYQVDPLMQLAGHKLALQGLKTEQSSVNVNKSVHRTNCCSSHYWAAVIPNFPSKMNPWVGAGTVPVAESANDFCNESEIRE